MRRCGRARTTPSCVAGQLSLTVPQTQGTAQQEVAFVSIRNSGSACHVMALSTLTVVQAGKPVRSIRGNPAREKISGTIRHGMTTLFDAGWSNWCGNRRAFRARATFGPETASGPYPSPVCLSSASVSRRQPVRYPLQSPPVAAP